MKTPPDSFSIKITEQDRQTARPYSSNENCIIATALQREGYEDVSVGGDDVHFGAYRYGSNVVDFQMSGPLIGSIRGSEPATITDAVRNPHRKHLKPNGPPWYKPSIVGIEVHFNRIPKE